MKKIEIKKRKFEGIVVSDKMQKTRVVEVSSSKKHPRYHRYYVVSRRFKAHDEDNKFINGDSVIIEETRPLSKEKRWKIIGFSKNYIRRETNTSLEE